MRDTIHQNTNEIHNAKYRHYLPSDWESIKARQIIRRKAKSVIFERSTYVKRKFDEILFD